jgi:hypothetical protein
LRFSWGKSTAMNESMKKAMTAKKRVFRSQELLVLFGRLGTFGIFATRFLTFLGA